MPRGLNRHILLAFEMMEERALGDAGSGAKLVHRGGVIVLFADHAQRHVQQSDAGVPSFGCGFTTRHGRTIPDRQSAVYGKRMSDRLTLGGRRLVKKKNQI